MTLDTEANINVHQLWRVVLAFNLDTVAAKPLFRPVSVWRSKGQENKIIITRAISSFLFNPHPLWSVLCRYRKWNHPLLYRVLSLGGTLLVVCGWQLSLSVMAPFLILSLLGTTLAGTSSLLELKASMWGRDFLASLGAFSGTQSSRTQNHIIF